MARLYIVLDSNVYFRLGYHAHPLLGRVVVRGRKKYRIYLIKQLQEEYRKNNRLQGKFPWVDEPDIKNNRERHRLTLSQEIEALIVDNFEYVRGEALARYPNVSKVDSWGIATCLGLQGDGNSIVFATDDEDAANLANEFEVETIRTVELLWLMQSANTISMEKAMAAAAEMNDGDKPIDFVDDFRRFFGTEPPSE